MKVIVCFDDVCVIVPCGDGEILVKELIAKAIHRYRKATGKAGNHWVDVVNLKTISGGGILDPDDELQDVCDDKEQLIASFEEEGRPILHNGGDGASASSSECTSPDHAQGEDGDAFGHDFMSNDNVTAKDTELALRKGDELSRPTPSLCRTIANSQHISIVSAVDKPTKKDRLVTDCDSQKEKNDIIVTSLDFSLGSTLRVRRGSEPALNTLGEDAIQRPLIPINNGIIPFHETNGHSMESLIDVPDDGNSENSSLDRRKKSLLARFSRDVSRASLGNRPEMYKWMEAQERREEKLQEKNGFTSTGVKKRKGPIGATMTEKCYVGSDMTEKGSMPVGVSDNDLALKAMPESVADEHLLNESTAECTVLSLSNDGGALGIHVVPASDNNQRDMGLMIQNVEAGGRVDKDGRLKEGDCIIEINGLDLTNASFTRAQEIFRRAMKTEEIFLKFFKHKRLPQPAPRVPPPVLPKPQTHPSRPSILSLASSEMTISVKDASLLTKPLSATNAMAVSKGESTLKAFVITNTHRHKNDSCVDSNAQFNADNMKSLPIKSGPPIEAFSPSKKTPPAVPVRHPTTSLTSQAGERPITTLTNTRRIGKKIAIELKKGTVGLGFSVTSRDNVTGGDIPIYIKNILPKGAAIQDGRLKPGDRLLEVNSISMSGKTQAEVVKMLRNTPQGSLVSLIVSRQEEVDDRFSVPREMASSQPRHTDGNTSDAHTLPTDDDVGKNLLKVATESRDSEGQIDGGDRLQRPGDSEVMLPLNVGLCKQEVIYLDIPLSDSGSAGLGVSVKGSTVQTESGQKDLGIYVKGVINGGAASKDGRLEFNDQLLEVNGFSLQGLSNVAAMEDLRRAMTSEGPLKGYIKLVIARNLASVPTATDCQQIDDSLSILPKRVLNRNALKGVIECTGLPTNHRQEDMITHLAPVSPKRSNDVINCSLPLKNTKSLQYFESDSSLRNESYMKATSGIFSNRSLLGLSPSGDGAFRTVEKGSSKSLLVRPSIDITDQDDVELEGEDFFHTSSPRRSPVKQRPHSTIGLYGLNDEYYSGGDDSWMCRVEQDEDGISSSTSPVKAFHREGYGRQSMSEKRKGHIDPRQLEIYQRARASKEQKEVKGTGERRPVAGLVGSSSSTALKRASSDEDLSQSAAQGDTYADESDMPHEPRLVSGSRNGNLGRVRSCNESFRAAVDRSYDALDSSAPMDTLEEESVESGSFTMGHQSTSNRSSFNSETVVGGDYGAVKRKSTRDKKHGTGLFGFLRFGKGRKSADDVVPHRSRSRSEERPSFGPVLHQHHQPPAVIVEGDVPLQHQKLGVQPDEYRQQARDTYHQRHQHHGQQQQQQAHGQYTHFVSSKSLHTDLCSASNAARTGYHDDGPFEDFHKQLHGMSDPVDSDYRRGHGSAGSMVEGAARSRAEHMQQLRSQCRDLHLARRDLHPSERAEMYNRRLPDDGRPPMMPMTDVPCNFNHAELTQHHHHHHHLQMDVNQSPVQKETPMCVYGNHSGSGPCCYQNAFPAQAVASYPERLDQCADPHPHRLCSKSRMGDLVPSHRHSTVDIMPGSRQGNVPPSEFQQLDPQTVTHHSLPPKPDWHQSSRPEMPRQPRTDPCRSHTPRFHLHAVERFEEESFSDPRSRSFSQQGDVYCSGPFPKVNDIASAETDDRVHHLRYTQHPPGHPHSAFESAPVPQHHHHHLTRLSQPTHAAYSGEVGVEQCDDESRILYRCGARPHFGDQCGSLPLQPQCYPHYRTNHHGDGDAVCGPDAFVDHQRQYFEGALPCLVQDGGCVGAGRCQDRFHRRGSQLV